MGHGPVLLLVRDSVGEECKYSYRTNPVYLADGSNPQGSSLRCRRTTRVDRRNPDSRPRKSRVRSETTGETGVDGWRSGTPGRHLPLLESVLVKMGCPRFGVWFTTVKCGFGRRVPLSVILTQKSKSKRMATRPHPQMM